MGKGTHVGRANTFRRAGKQVLPYHLVYRCQHFSNGGLTTFNEDEWEFETDYHDQESLVFWLILSV